ncbi:MAG: DNA-binding protein [Chloroflexi bacterium]|nr:DNA-binding protein [Chloroflexota bacterium]
MTTITVDLSGEPLERLREMSARLGVSPEDLVRVSVEELLTRPDKDFQRALEYTLKKNRELYRRLA